jgi:hypothetical protein
MPDALVIAGIAAAPLVSAALFLPPPPARPAGVVKMPPVRITAKSA